MNKGPRTFFMTLMTLGRAALVVVVSGTVAGSCASSESPPPFPAFDVMEKSISELAEAMESGEVTSRALVEMYLNRISAYDQRGPALQSMITINANALAEAERLDAERATSGPRGPLHGVPVIVKDNFDTVDMPTTGGIIALATSVPPDDAFQVRKLREAGAIILGKANLHELARGITTVSSFGGQTRNTYDPERNPGGSSGGTGAAVAASFAAVGMGSDTCGSIRIPSAHNSLVGLRGTRGLSSRDGIIPLSHTQDIGGPLARTVADLVAVLDVTVGLDPADDSTRLSEGNIPASYSEFLNEDALRGARLGLLVELVGEAGEDRPVRDVIEAAIGEMQDQGAETVEIGESGLLELLEGSGLQEFRFDLADYLRQSPDAPVRSLEEIVERGLFHEALERSNRTSMEVESLDTVEYREAIARRDEVRQAVLALMDEHQLDALVYPTIRQTAMPIGTRQTGSNCRMSALSGLPAITVPAGFAQDGTPVGVELLGRVFAEPRLIAIAYAYEQATQHRRPHRPINLDDKLRKVTDHWSPKVIAKMNDYRFKLVKFKGEFVWHSHADTDEAFLVIDGTLTVYFRDGSVELSGGELFVVPRGVEHKTFAGRECHAMLVERAGTINTGDVVSDLTAQDDVWI